MRKKTTAWILCLVMVLSMFPAISWAAASPDLTRAQMISLVNRALGVKKEASLQGYADVKKEDWFYEDMARAVAIDLLEGSEKQLMPNQLATREQVFVVLARVLERASTTQAPQDSSDLSDVSSWARSSLYALIEQGYLRSIEGRIDPQGHLTEKECQQLIEDILGTYLNNPETYDQDIQGNLVVNTDNVTLKTLTITGDLIVGDPSYVSTLSMKDVTIQGRMLVKGQKEDDPLHREQIFDILTKQMLKYKTGKTKDAVKKAYESLVAEKDQQKYMKQKDCASLLLEVFDLGDVKAARELFSEKTLEEEREATRKDLSRFLMRIHTQMATSEQDDFYTVINHSWLEEKRLQASDSWDMQDENRKKKDKRIEEMIQEIVASEAPVTSTEQRIKDFYCSFVDLDTREERGATFIEDYWDRIDRVSTLSELADLEAAINNESSVQPLLRWYVYRDEKDSTKNLVYFEGLPGMILKNNLRDDAEDEIFVDAYETYLEEVCALVANSPKDAQDILSLEKEVASEGLTTEEYWDLEHSYNPYKQEDFLDLFVEYDVKTYMEAIGFSGAQGVIVHNEGAVQRLGQLLVEDNLELLKSLAKVNVYYYLSELLVGEYKKPIDNFYEKIGETVDQRDIEQQAPGVVRSYFPDDIERLYVEKYFSKEAKDDLMSMAQGLAQAYETLFQENTWLSEGAQEKAIEKIRAMTFKLAYPKTWADIHRDAVVLPDCFIENALGLAQNINQELKRTTQVDPVNRDDWFFWYGFDDQSYNRDVNEIIFSSEALQGDVYDPNRPREENLGGIGVWMAREMAHAFDQEGGKRDIYGRINPWWTPEDMGLYRHKLLQLEGAYDHAEILPGFMVDEKNTVEENLADLIGLQVALHVCVQEKDADLASFFESYARFSKNYLKPDLLFHKAQESQYVPAKIRVNKTLSHMDAFHTTYGTKEGDAMYVAKKDRIQIW